ncbi:MAG: hypothetical protein ABL893_11630 [Hyphomicrobium sp.]|nr:hypothetical protein [Hyphomicrobium sp.]
MATDISGTPNLHIIVTRDGILLVRADGAAAADFQTHYAGFTTSFGPLDRDGVLDTFENEWPDLLAINHDAIRTFTKGIAPAQPELRLVMNGGPP